jgi:hypothetical protein
MRRGKRGWTIAGAVILVALAMPAAGAAGKARTSYFVKPNAGRTQVSMAVRGHDITSGYVYNNHDRCRGYPQVRGYFMDFEGTKIRAREFKDVDGRSWYRDTVAGRLSDGAVSGRYSSWADFTTPGPICRAKTRFSLERVDRARWRRYTRKERRIDPNFPENRVPGFSRAR